MEEFNRPPEFNLSIFDSSNLKLFESESKNEIFYEIVPFIVQSRPILITFFGLSCLFLVLSLIFTSLEWRKLSITISVFNFVLFSGYIVLFLGLSSTTFDVFEPLFSFRLQHHNYQRNGYIRTLSDWTTAPSTNHQLENMARKSKNISAANFIFREYERKNNCCGIKGPGDYSKSNELLKLLVGKSALPAWLRSHGFTVHQAQESFLSKYLVLGLGNFSPMRLGLGIFLENIVKA